MKKTSSSPASSADIEANHKAATKSSNPYPASTFTRFCPDCRISRATEGGKWTKAGLGKRWSCAGCSKKREAVLKERANGK